MNIKFINPFIEVIEIETDDIITTSGGTVKQDVPGKNVPTDDEEF